MRSGSSVVRSLDSPLPVQHLGGETNALIRWIKIDHFRGLVGPLEGQGGARESKIVPKRGLKQALLGPFWVYK